MIEWAVSLAEARRGTNRFENVLSGAGDGSFQREAFGDSKGDRRRQRAAGTVSRAGVDAGRLEAHLDAVGGAKNVDHHLPLQMPTFDEHRRGAEEQESFRGSPEIGRTRRISVVGR